MHSVCHFLDPVHHMDFVHGHVMKHVEAVKSDAVPEVGHLPYLFKPISLSVHVTFKQFVKVFFN